MRSIASILLLALSCLACDSEPATITDVTVERSEDIPPIVGCCECMTADLVNFWPECHSHMCDDSCVTGEMTKGCEWVDGVLTCPNFVCP